MMSWAEISEAMRKEAEKRDREIEAMSPEERQRIIDQFTRPDGTLCEHWWQPSVEGWG